MGQENNTGDNAGNGGNSNSGGTNARLTEAECIANKTFFETYGLYPGKYDVDTNDSMYREYKSEINVNGECTFEIYQPSYGSDMSSSKPKLKNWSLNLDLNSKKIIWECYNLVDGNNTLNRTWTGTFSKFDFKYSDKNINKHFYIYWRNDTSSSEDDDTCFRGELPKEAFLLGGHEDCSGFRTEKQDLCTLNGIEHGEFTVNNDENQKLNISENRMEYIDSTSNIHLIYDFVNETVYNVNTDLNYIIAEVPGSSGNGNFNLTIALYKNSKNDFNTTIITKASNKYTFTLRK